MSAALGFWDLSVLSAGQMFACKLLCILPCSCSAHQELVFPTPHGEQHSWEWCQEHTLGLRKPDLISILHIHSLSHSRTKVPTLRGAQGLRVSEFSTHTEHIWLIDPKFSLRSLFFYQQVHIITRQHESHLLQWPTHPLLHVVFLHLPKHHQTSLNPHPRSVLHKVEQLYFGAFKILMSARS